VPLDLKLIRQDSGERRTHMLSHLGANDVDCYRSVSVNAVPERWLERVLSKGSFGRYQRVNRGKAKRRRRTGHACQKVAPRWETDNGFKSVLKLSHL
jgi:hypothetical protein